jgi:diaminopimelate epimerase
MKIQFNKYEGTGNDFIVIKNSPALIDHSDTLLIRRLCDRRFGIGADGLVLVEDFEGYDFRMVYFNSDGSRGAMCGNGGRCAAHFMMKNNTGLRSLTFMADDGPHNAVSKGDDIIEVSIGNVSEVRNTPDGLFINTGVPHLVIFTDDTDSTDLVSLARPLRYSSRYAPEGVNVNIVQVLGDRIKVRTYERGVEDETLACGTGITASAIAAALSGKIVTDRPVVMAKGGTLSVRFILNDVGASDIYLTGPATFVFSGEIEP